eukprot:TRINITY_DN4543_c0_g1_i2.p1 TRINITY_DN4543_c0_g1~~TRINITY_DN4543_c0_g1_i2.p1  ORF type:complete len:134 (+),score=43.10 TRINITY_DN4543_c0_g1_i2:507-908(+)
MSSGLPGKRDNVFTTVGKPRAQVIQYDNPINCYSNDVIEEMMEDNVSWKKSLNQDVKKNNPPARVGGIAGGFGRGPMPPPSGPPMPSSVASGDKSFNPRNSSVLAFLSEQERVNNMNPSQSEIYHTPLPRYFY